MDQPVGVQEFEAEGGLVQPGDGVTGHQPGGLPQHHDPDPLAAPQGQLPHQLQALRGQFAVGRYVDAVAQGVEVRHQQPLEVLDVTGEPGRQGGVGTGDVDSGGVGTGGVGTGGVGTGGVGHGGGS